eukprot:CAMPEP_0118884022 /NCGR_PEP_ID=MMETSP1163-20130328/22959_1 /TAXON_ID=124430 /ORGANISM="Phaeomonas parva, Strain CCMP2877" /LENGTH=186 /DNA_ID=CAMNT_0006821655 /DNA_START=226 /DNA_END=787 /DNA_ORIENTATION=-
MPPPDGGGGVFLRGDVLGERLDALEGLLAARHDVLRRQREAVLARVAQLHAVAVDDAALAVGVVRRAAARGVDGRGDGPVLVPGAVHGLERLDGGLGAGVLRGVVRRLVRGVAPGAHPELRVGVEVDIDAELVRAADELLHRGDLGLVPGGAALEGLGALVRGRPRLAPVEVPVAVRVRARAERAL